MGLDPSTPLSASASRSWTDEAVLTMARGSAARRISAMRAGGVAASIGT